MFPGKQTHSSPHQLQHFVAGLAGLSLEEIRKAKLLYVKSQLRELQAMETTYASFRKLQGCLALIPFFWPVLWVQRKTMDAEVVMRREQIRDALGIWHEDLGDDRSEIEQQLEALEDTPNR